MYQNITLLNHTFPYCCLIYITFFRTVAYFRRSSLLLWSRLNDHNCFRVTKRKQLDLLVEEVDTKEKQIMQYPHAVASGGPSRMREMGTLLDGGWGTWPRHRWNALACPNESSSVHVVPSHSNNFHHHELTRVYTVAPRPGMYLGCRHGKSAWAISPPLLEVNWSGLRAWDYWTGPVLSCHVSFFLWFSFSAFHCFASVFFGFLCLVFIF